MQSLWCDSDAAAFTDDLQLRVYTSRLLGCDKTLVLHGGGNTSVKIRERDLYGDPQDVLYVKGSGWDLETIATAGFTPLRLVPVQRLATLDVLSDTEMVNQLALCKTDAAAPSPSVEAILHAILPYKYVDHTHADAIVAITNTADGLARIAGIYGDEVVIVPYVMPGFELARECARRFGAESNPRTIGMVLMNHGIFSFGRTARESYERMISLVDRAERYLAEKRALPVSLLPAMPPDSPRREEITALRRAVSRAAGAPMILSTHRDARSLGFAQRADVEQISQHGPATPDHVIRIKRVPMLGRNVAAYSEAYKDYFGKHESGQAMLDAAPRVVLDPELGVCAIGRSAKDAAIGAEIYSHTMDIIERATSLGGYKALDARELFEVEYWDLEQAKLRKTGKPAPFAGEVALVTGGARGIGAACVDALLSCGAAVIALDMNGEVETLHDRADFLGVLCDVTSQLEIERALETGVRRFGGLDMLVLNAGIFPQSSAIAQLTDATWRKTMDVNLDANLKLMRACHPLLKLAPRRARVVVIGSKNVEAPGPAAAAYSASKAALNQLARVAALEWAADGIRVNVVHPNAVFDTGIWTEEVLAQRAAHYGMSVDQYRKDNLLNVEITSCDVGAVVAELCGDSFAKTTGAQIAIDGGNERVI